MNWAFNWGVDSLSLVPRPPGTRLSFSNGGEGKYDITTTEVSLLICIPIAFISRILISGWIEQLDKSRVQTSLA